VKNIKLDDLHGGTNTKQSKRYFLMFLYWCCSLGKSPWEFELTNFNDFSEVTKSIIISRRKKPLAPSFFNNEISKDIDKVVLTSLELNIENRYKSGTDFLTAINQIN